MSGKRDGEGDGGGRRKEKKELLDGLRNWALLQLALQLVLSTGSKGCPELAGGIMSAGVCPNG